MDKIWILNFFLFSQGLYFLKVALKIAFNINVRKKNNTLNLWKLIF